MRVASKPRKPKAKSYCSAHCASTKSKCAYPRGFYDVNVASFSLPSLGRKKPVTLARRVTYVGGDASATFTASLELPPGYTGEVTPPSLSFTAPGQELAFTVTITPGPTAARTWRFGSLTWTDGGAKWRVRSPLAVQRK